MPLIKVQTSITEADSDNVEALLTTLSAKLANHLSKSEAYIMTAFEPGIKMTFAGSFEPVCYLEIKSVGTMSSKQTSAMSQDFCQVIQDKLGVSSDRIYIEFADAKGAMWGWNKRTFG